MTSPQQALSQYKNASYETITALKDSNGPERDEAVREALRLIHVLQKPADYANRLIVSPLELTAVAVAMEWGIFKAIVDHKGPITVKELTRLVKGGDEALVQRTVQSLAAHGSVDQLDKTQYIANDITRHFTVPSRIGSVMVQTFSMRSYAELPWYLSSNGFQTPPNLNECPWQVAVGQGTNFWDSMKKDPRMKHPELGFHFNNYMEHERPYSDGRLVDIYPFEKLFAGSGPEDVLFVDIGGGHGHQCANLRSSFPKSRGRIILQDLAYAIESSKVQDIDGMKHDMFTEQTIKGAKSYYFKAVLHDYDDELCRKILRQTAAAMGPESRLLIHESLIEEYLPTINSVRQDFCMMSVLGGQERGEAHMKRLLEESGLKVIGTFKPAPDQWTITEAVRA